MNGQPPVTVYWRPGCGFCHVLRRELDRVGVERTEINIWEDSNAAAVVRSHARGNETVPTVLVGGDLALVNPTAAEVLAACELGAGASLPGGPPVRALGLPSSHSPWTAAAWTVAACVIWAGFALAHPTTTYHLAPVAALLSWPAIERGRRPGDGWRPGLLAAAGATILAIVTILLLASRHALAGPALIGPNATAEAFALTATAALAAFVLARPRQSGESAQPRGDGVQHEVGADRDAQSEHQPWPGATYPAQGALVTPAQGPQDQSSQHREAGQPEQP